MRKVDGVGHMCFAPSQYPLLMLINHKNGGKMLNDICRVCKFVIIFTHENRRNLFEETENECKTWKRGAQSAI